MWLCAQCNDRVERGWRCPRGHFLFEHGGKEGSFWQGFWRALGFSFLVIVVLGFVQEKIRPHIGHGEIIGIVDIVVLLAMAVLGFHYLWNARLWQKSGGVMATAARRKRGDGAGILAVICVMIALIVLESLTTKR